ncbi:unnamed protein product [Ambrosiozyma monospora]|uniref:Unnamed protein product n=1 Tax=Ambrosiozyma monospora TaxID=43982 RepID=A0ACB5SUJ3_AMBMO|nr:unnamed protein product [Ambrosiozyma monospora]
MSLYRVPDTSKTDGPAGDLRTPISKEAPPTIATKYIRPNNVGIAINLQMDYLLMKKSQLMKFLLGSKITLSVMITILSYLANDKLASYYSVYNFPPERETWKSILQLFLIDMFKEDLFNFLLQSALTIGLTCVALYFKTGFLKFESDDVPKNLERYFGTDFSIFQKTNSPNDKAFKNLDKQLQKESKVISYREVPIAFIVKQDKAVVEKLKSKSEEQKQKKKSKTNNKTGSGAGTGNKDETGSETNVTKTSKKTTTATSTSEDGAYQVTGLGIRRVYIKSGILNELLLLEMKDPSVKKLYMDVYSFEKQDIDILTNAGFVLESETTLTDFVLGGIFRISVKHFVWVKPEELVNN